jgi:hypothetical protein
MRIVAAQMDIIELNMYDMLNGDAEPAKASRETLRNRPTVRFTTNALLINATLGGALSR